MINQTIHLTSNTIVTLKFAGFNSTIPGPCILPDTLNNTGMKKIAVIGSGTMGNGIAHVFALYGYKVALSDVSQKALGKADITIIAKLDRMIKKELNGMTQKEQESEESRVGKECVSTCRSRWSRYQKK